MKSIIQEDKTVCFLCGGGSGLEPLDEHHVFNGPNRKLSEKYGLKVYLHHARCHLNGVHKDAVIANSLKQIAQKKAMVHFGWSKDEFRNIFGKSYL